MIKTELKYCVYDPDRHGNDRYYVRQLGKPKMRIREPFKDAQGNITPEFMAAYWAALKVLNGTAAPPAAAPREETFDWLVDRYYRSEAFAELGEATRRVRKGILNRFCTAAGKLPYRKFRRADVLRSREKRRETPGAADNLIKALSRVFTWAIEEGLVSENPTAGVKRLHKSDGHHTWTPAEIEIYRKHHPIGTRPRLALELLLSVGARRSDAVRLGRQHEHEGWLRFIAWKNRERARTEIVVPIQAELRHCLDATATGDLTYIVRENGAPFTVAGFGNAFRDWCDAAELQHCSAHGLRKAAATALAEGGVTAPELCAIFGWSKLETAEIYIRKANKKRMAGNAFARLDDYRKRESVSLSSPQKAGETKRGKSDGKSKPK